MEYRYENREELQMEYFLAVIDEFAALRIALDKKNLLKSMTV